MKEADSRAAAIAYLRADAPLHMSMICPLERGSADVLTAEQGDVLLYERKSKTYMLSANTYAKGAKLAELIPADAALFLAHQDFTMECLREKFALTSVRECVQVLYLRQEPLPLRGLLPIRQLGLEYLPQLLVHYHGVDDPAYVEELLKEGLVYGGFAAGELAGFIGMHLEGSMGLLEVFPQHRRCGYGLELESYLINCLLAQGQTPFGQVMLGNEKSLALQRRLGFACCAQHLYWMY